MGQETKTHGEEHVLDVDFEVARSIHRIVRAMHDGECPQCHRLFESQHTHSFTGSMVCPGCNFIITAREAQAAIEEFAVVMDRNLEVFRKWRASRPDLDPF